MEATVIEMMSRCYAKGARLTRPQGPRSYHKEEPYKREATGSHVGNQRVVGARGVGRQAPTTTTTTVKGEASSTFGSGTEYVLDVNDVRSDLLGEGLEFGIVIMIRIE
jgi:hypothetical protein